MTDRAAYWRQYHAAHRAERNARALARYYANRETIQKRRRQRAAHRRWWRKHREIIKVARGAGISIPQARQMMGAP